MNASTPNYNLCKFNPKHPSAKLQDYAHNETTHLEQNFVLISISTRMTIKQQSRILTTCQKGLKT